MLDGKRTWKQYYFTLLLLIWITSPITAIAQTDPDWARQEMERMQAQQERFNAQVERQRAEQERITAQREREVARRERAQDERQTVPNVRETPFDLRIGDVADEAGVDSYPTFLATDRIGEIFDLAVVHCQDRNSEDLEKVARTLSFTEFLLLMDFCFMYDKGRGKF